MRNVTASRTLSDRPFAAPVLIEHERQPSDNLKPVINPAQVDEVVGHVALGTAEDADAAVAAADGASPSWSALSADERASVLAERKVSAWSRRKKRARC
jgi:delta 1-pyrroline-5-carboxylate dehydrogenase